MYDLYHECLHGHIDTVRLIIEQANGDLDWNPGVAGACMGGHIDIVRLMIEASEAEELITGEKWPLNFGWGLFYLCKDGRMDIINLLIEKAGPEGCFDWDCGLRGACVGGQTYIVLFMIEKGATDFNGGLDNACQGGYMNIVHLMISHGANSWKNSFISACKSGNIDIVHLIIKKYKTFGLQEIGDLNSRESEEPEEEEEFKECSCCYPKGLDWNSGLSSACSRGHMDIVHLMLENGADNFWNGYIGACYGNYTDIVLLMINKAVKSKGSKDLYWDWNSGLDYACQYKNIDLALIMIEKGADVTKLYGSCRKEYTSRVTELVYQMNINDCSGIVYDFIGFSSKFLRSSIYVIPREF